jgi:hypothetical protein
MARTQKWGSAPYCRPRLAGVAFPDPVSCSPHIRPGPEALSIPLSNLVSE